MMARVAVPMVSPWSEQRDQQFERELKTIKLNFPADHDQERTMVGAMTKAFESMVNFVQNLDEGLWHRLPEDVLPKIFARLPFRSLFKIRLLSKAWMAHMESTAFQLEATPEILSTWESYSPLLCSSMQNMRIVGYSHTSRRWERLFSLSYLFAEGHLSSSRSWQMRSIAGSLLCLKQVGEPGERGILVTNTVLKSWRVLPQHGLMTPFLPAYEIMHLINLEERDSSTYNVISISQDSSIQDPYKRLPSQVPQDLLVPQTHLRAEIYDSVTGAWTVDESGPVVPTDLHNVSSVYLDGVVYFSLASSRYESFHLFAYNVMRGGWTTILAPQESSSLVQLTRCGSSVMLVLSSPAGPHLQGNMHYRKPRFGPSTDNKICEGSISIYEIGPDLKSTKLSGGPSECIQGVKIVEGISGDEDSIYLQAFGRPLVVVFNVKQKLWSTVAVRLGCSDNVTDDDSEKVLRMSSRHIGPCFNWSNSTFQPGLNPFVAP